MLDKANRNFHEGMLKNLADTVKGLLIDPYIKKLERKAAVIDWGWAKITGAENSRGEQYIKNEINQGKTLLKDPFLIVEGMVQGANDTLENKGIAYTAGYVTTEVAKDILIKKIATGEIKLGKASGSVNYIDEVVEGGSKVNNSFYKKGGGSDLDDFMTLHSEKHAFNSDVKSTKKATQFGENIDVTKLRKDTMLYPDKVVYNKNQNVIIYKKEYGFNISTPDTPTGSHRVYINLDSKPRKTNRNSQFPYYGGNK